MLWAMQQWQALQASRVRTLFAHQGVYADFAAALSHCCLPRFLTSENNKSIPFLYHLLPPIPLRHNLKLQKLFVFTCGHMHPQQPVLKCSSIWWRRALPLQAVEINNFAKQGLFLCIPQTPYDRPHMTLKAVVLTDRCVAEVPMQCESTAAAAAVINIISRPPIVSTCTVVLSSTWHVSYTHN